MCVCVCGIYTVQSSQFWPCVCSDHLSTFVVLLVAALDSVFMDQDGKTNLKQGEAGRGSKF